MMQEMQTMTHRYTLAAILLAALSIPAAAQQTTQPDTSKKTTPTTSTSNGAIADSAAAKDTAAKTTSTPAMSSPGVTVTSPAPASPNASNANNPSGVTSSPSGVTSAPSTGVTSAPSTGVTSAPSTGVTSAPSTGVTSSPSSGVTSAPSSGLSSGAAASAGGPVSVQPTSGSVKVDVKVAESLVNTVKISGDSAFALARASNDAGQISSAELEMKDKALVYNIKMIKGAGASVVYVDAMTGEVVKDKKYGGLKASAENDKQLKKLNDAKKDSSATAKP
ncbi:MAG: hypothetical protein DMD35_16265 [Gemmatimonadetes bacterium]|nr:MAG: hypothetical protein DMD35_16265 [Gemmatimonadota bacterium]